MKIRVSVAVLALAVMPAALHAQTAEERIALAMQRAAEAGVPTSLLESKIAEGRAKGVPMDRIAAAVEARQAALLRARAAMARRAANVSESDLGLGADAVQAGVSEAVLAAIAERADGEHRGVAIAALTELVHMGHVPEEALIRVTEALGRGPAALMNLPAQARAQQRQGPPATVPPPATRRRGGGGGL